MSFATREEILDAICEQPGWQPPQPMPSHVEAILLKLQQDGYIASRLDGWEATPLALDEYPFTTGKRRVRHSEAEWQACTLPTAFLRKRQRVQAEFEQDAVRGVVDLLTTYDLAEVEITIRFREL